MNKAAPELILNCTADIDKLNTAQGYFPHTVSCIKAIRSISMCGLKEAKDGWDQMRSGKAFTIPVLNENDVVVEQCKRDLKTWGVSVVSSVSPREAIIFDLKKCANKLLDANDCQGAIEIIETIRRLSGD